ncbi:MAG: serine/threonine protein kinase [Bradymonadia bacterium]
MSDNKDESQNFCASCNQPVTSTDVECPNCGFGLKTQSQPLKMGVVLEGRYRIDAIVGRGGAGVVYKGTDLTLSRDIAVKALVEQSADPITLARFLHEARNLASVEHRGLVPVYAVGQENGAHYMVMKYIDGSTLADLIKQRGKLPEPTVRQILIETCDALTTLHAAGLIHRDLKPANLMIGKDGRVSVVDLGIVKRVTERNEASGQGAGTPKYMAPEMFSDADVTLRADIYSLGIVGFHCLAGHPPFDGPTPMAILYKQAHEAPPSLQKLGLNLSPEICNVLNKAMAKNPRERHATAREFAEALARPVRNRKRTGSFVGVVIALIAMGLFFLNPQTTGSEKTKAAQSSIDVGIVEVSKPSTPEPAEKPIPTVVTVELKAGFPEEIQLALDNGETVPTPYSMEAEQNSASIEIRAFAKGFEDKTLTINFDKNVQLAIILKKKASKSKTNTKPTGFRLQPLEYED